MESNNTIVQSKFYRAAKFLLVFSPLFLALLLSFWSNGDFIKRKHIQSRNDEAVTMRHLRKIITEAKNNGITEKFIYRLTDFDRYHYGRFMYMVGAVVAFIPYHVWKYKGMVYSVRMSQSIFLLAAYFIFAITFFNLDIFRFLFLSLATSLPSTVYYQTTHKPEPLQILMIALFFYFYKKGNNLFQFIFLGIAYGCKISTSLVLLPLTLFLLYDFRVKYKDLSEFAYHFMRALGFFVLGFFIAVPGVFKAGGFGLYIEQMVKYSGQHVDDFRVTILDWFVRINGAVFDNNSFLSVSILTALIILVVENSLGKRSFNELITKNRIRIIAIGLFYFLMICLFVKRMWIMYLHIPFLFISIYIVLNCECFWANKKYVKSIILSLLMIVFMVFVRAQLNLENYKKLANRTQSEQFKFATYSDEFIRGIWSRVLRVKKSGPVKILLEGGRFFGIYKQNKDEISVHARWHAFSSLDQSYDIVALDSDTYLKIYDTKYHQSRRGVGDFTIHREKFLKYIKNCDDSSFCLTRINTGHKNLVLFVNSKYKKLFKAHEFSSSVFL